MPKRGRRDIVPDTSGRKNWAGAIGREPVGRNNHQWDREVSSGEERHNEPHGKRMRRDSNPRLPPEAPPGWSEQASQAPRTPPRWSRSSEHAGTIQRPRPSCAPRLRQGPSSISMAGSGEKMDACEDSDFDSALSNHNVPQQTPASTRSRAWKNHESGHGQGSMAEADAVHDFLSEHWTFKESATDQQHLAEEIDESPDQLTPKPLHQFRSLERQHPVRRNQFQAFVGASPSTTTTAAGATVPPAPPPPPSDWQSYAQATRDRSRYKNGKTGHTSRESKPPKEPFKLWPQAFLSDLPSEWREDEIRQFHVENGLENKELPISIKFLGPNKDVTGETSACIARYSEDCDLQHVLCTLSGTKIVTRSGKTKWVGAKKPKPARWMVEAGLVDEPVGEPSKVRFRNLPVESTIADIRLLHQENGLGIDDMPENAYFQVQQKEDAETGNCIVTYKDDESLQRVINKLQGSLVATRTGKLKHLVLRRVDQNEKQPGAPDAEPSNAKFFADIKEDLTGVVTSWHEEKAYGFVQADIGGPDLFVHRRAISGGQHVKPGTVVLFRPCHVPDKQRYEATQVRVKSIPEASQVPCEDSQLMDAELVSAVKPSKNQEEAVGFDYWREVWELDVATASWLSRLDLELQTAVMEKYKDPQWHDPFPHMGKEISSQPSKRVLVAGFPKGLPQDSLLELLRQYGEVDSFKLVTPGMAAVVQMSSLEDAALLVEDLRFEIPSGFESPLVVRYVVDEANLMKELPQGKILIGTCTSWEGEYGWVAAHGAVPQLDTFLQKGDIYDADSINEGTTVLFTAIWNKEYGKYNATRCICTPDHVKAKLRVAGGTGKSVRAFARTMQKKFSLQSEIAQIVKKRRT